MAAVTVVIVLVVTVTVVVFGEVRVESGEEREKIYEVVSNPYRGLYERPLMKKTEHFRFPEPGEQRQDNPKIYSARISGSEEESHRRKPRFNDGEMYFLPVRFDLNRHSFTERALRSDDYHSPSPSPRLIMDKDFNIRFDNPYIIPLTKPLALVLDSAVKARQDGFSGEKMMIPFPVLVKARKPLLDREGFRDYRDDDDVPEHRSNFDDDDLYLEDTSPKKKLSKKLSSSKKAKKNGTTTYHNSNDQKAKVTHKGKGEPPNDQLLPESRIVNRKTNETMENQEDVLPGSSDEVTHPDAYPGKIFAEMYHNIPKYPFDSLESQEYGNHKFDPLSKKKYANELTTEGPKPLHRPRVKSASKYPINGQIYSASTDFEWVTQANSSKARKFPSNEENSNRRIIIHDVLEEPFNRTIPTFMMPAMSSQGVNISEQFWRHI